MADTFGLGIDLLLHPDLDPTGELVEGFACLGQDLLSRFQTPRGGLFYDASYGLDLRVYLEEGLTPAKLQALPGDVSQEAEKDERVDSCSVKATMNFAAEKLTIELSVQTANGPFTLVLTVDKLTVELLRLEET